jgi:hypothetical protein
MRVGERVVEEGEGEEVGSFPARVLVVATAPKRS